MKVTDGQYLSNIPKHPSLVSRDDNSPHNFQLEKVPLDILYTLDVAHKVETETDVDDMMEGAKQQKVGDIEDLFASTELKGERRNKGDWKQHELACEEGAHHYIDHKTGYNVFSALAHRTRGVCCGQGHTRIIYVSIYIYSISCG